MVEQPAREPSEDLVRALLATWRELEPYAGANGTAQGLGDARVIDKWRWLFGPEILYVRSARNRVAHAPDSMTRSEPRETVKAARKLRDLLFSGLDNPAAVLGS